MTSKWCLTSTDDIESVRVVVIFCVGLKLSLVETLKQIQNAHADRAHDTGLDFDLFGFSLTPHHKVQIKPPLAFVSSLI